MSQGFAQMRRRAVASPGGRDAQPFAAADAVGLEVVVIDGKNSRERFTLRQVDERGVREVHRTVVILAHERLDVGQIPVRDREDRDRTRAVGPHLFHERLEPFVSCDVATCANYGTVMVLLAATFVCLLLENKRPW